VSRGPRPSPDAWSPRRACRRGRRAAPRDAISRKRSACGEGASGRCSSASRPRAGARGSLDPPAAHRPWRAAARRQRAAPSTHRPRAARAVPVEASPSWRATPATRRSCSPRASTPRISRPTRHTSTSGGHPLGARRACAQGGWGCGDPRGGPAFGLVPGRRRRARVRGEHLLGERLRRTVGRQGGRRADHARAHLEAGASRPTTLRSSGSTPAPRGRGPPRCSARRRKGAPRRPSRRICHTPPRSRSTRRSCTGSTTLSEGSGGRPRPAGGRRAGRGRGVGPRRGRDTCVLDTSRVPYGLRRSAPKAGGPSTRLATALDAPGPLVVDGTSL
jgi:hypothetical protein